MLRILNFALLLLCFHTSFAQNQKWSLNTDQSEISYNASHVLHPWEGINKQVKGVMLLDTEKNEIKELAVLTFIRDFDSKNSGRDAHALEVLEALSFPDVRFYSNLTENKNDSILIHGELDFHGVIKNYTFVAEQQNTSDTMILSGTFDVKPTDFDIELPSFMMVKMEDLLQFKFDLEFANDSSKK